MLSTPLLIYISHFLSSWGDRMWYFAIPLFLLHLEPHSLALSAAYGLTVSISVLFFGPLVGDWIDRSQRLFCVKITLVIQNVAVILCAILLLLNQLYGDNESSYIILVKIGAIALGSIANLASVGTGIIIQKDWIVVVAGGNQEQQADLNSMTRRIDLSTKILAPVACGQIMALTSLSGGAIFIMCWNGVSMFIEYYLLQLIYKRTPALVKNFAGRSNENNGEEMEALHQNIESTFVASDKISSEISPTIAEQNDMSKTSMVKDTGLNENKEVKVKNKQSVWRKIFSFITILKKGWKIYIAQPIAVPCIGFSCLYMTILGFGYITIAYAYSQCFSELTVGLLQAGAAVTGIIATFMFPPMRKRVGVVMTGIFFAIFQLLTLIPCVASIFLAGSPFYLLQQNMKTNISNTNLITENPLNSTVSTFSNTSYQYFTEAEDNGESSDHFIKCLENVDLPSSFVSLSLLMSGIILARVGLWGFDLTITQMIQETVREKERGIFNGVQSSLNNFMDLLRFIFVLALPLPNQFGILIMLSTFFVSVGYFMYFDYARKNYKKFSSSDS